VALVALIGIDWRLVSTVIVVGVSDWPFHSDDDRFGCRRVAAGGGGVERHQRVGFRVIGGGASAGVS
jgi:hypothetical protein